MHEKPAPNGAGAKAGLNRSLLDQALGKILMFTRYKAARAGKPVLTVPARFSSQECSCCGHTSPAIRKSQARGFILPRQTRRQSGFQKHQLRRLKAARRVFVHERIALARHPDEGAAQGGRR